MLKVKGKQPLLSLFMKNMILCIFQHTFYNKTPFFDAAPPSIFKEIPKFNLFLATRLNHTPEIACHTSWHANKYLQVKYMLYLVSFSTYIKYR